MGGKMGDSPCALPWTPDIAPSPDPPVGVGVPLTPSEDQEGCQDQVGGRSSSCCFPESRILPSWSRAKGLRASQLHGEEVGRRFSPLLPVFLFLLQASLLGALHTLVDGLRGSWGQPLLWGAWCA